MLVRGSSFRFIIFYHVDGGDQIAKLRNSQYSGIVGRDHNKIMLLLCTTSLFSPYLEFGKKMFQKMSRYLLFFQYFVYILQLNNQDF